ncbi:MAG TPA: universal stress protein [Steroidobacteraceae bacterium]|nr:universal stress protein [Steroidobacteraceae bacterium]
MDKLTSILAIVPEGGAQGASLEKICRLIRKSSARVELYLAAPSDYFAVAGRVAALGCGGAVAFTMHDGVTPLRDAVMQRARDIGADLLVAPRAQVEFERCPIPVLLLGRSTWAAEPRFAAAVDVTEPDSDALSRRILHVAGFLAQRFVAHLDILYSETEKHDETLRLERAVRLARLVREYHVGCERLQVFEGPPQQTLPPLLAERCYDVIVLGTVPRHRALLATFHSITRRLLQSTDSDILLVDPAEAAARTARPASAGQQLAHQA